MENGAKIAPIVILTYSFSPCSGLHQVYKSLGPGLNLKDRLRNCAHPFPDFYTGGLGSTLPLLSIPVECEALTLQNKAIPEMLNVR